MIFTYHRRLTTGILTASLLAACTLLWAGPKPDEVLQQYLAFIKNYTQILADIKDPASAEAAEPELKAAAQEFQDLRAQLEGLTKEREQANALRGKIAKPMGEAMRSLQTEKTRLLQNPELAGRIQPLLEATFGTKPQQTTN